MRLIALVILASIAACSSVPPPENVSFSQKGGGTVIDKVDHSFKAPAPIDFSKAKLCVIENSSNDPVVMRDASRSFVGAYTGNVYHVNQSQVVGGGSAIKYLSEEDKTIVGVNVAEFYRMMLQHKLKYDVRVSLNSPNDIQMIFSNVSMLQVSTGYAANTGYSPVYHQFGSGSDAVIEQLAIAANQIKSCING